MSGMATDHLTPAATGPVISAGSARDTARSFASKWERALVVGAVVAAALAVWLTLRAGFLAYPGWLAVQKADFILGPIAVGLYWRHSRPNSRFGLLLIVLGLLGAVYVLESSTTPWLFRIGVVSEDAIYLWTTVVILAFPSGRLGGLPEWLVIALNAATAVLVLVLFWPPSAPGFTISGCRVDCPGTAGGTSFTASWLIRHHVLASLPVVVALATAGVIAWRFVTGTPPRRRALAIGTPVALLFLFSEAAYRGLFVFAPGGLGPSARPVEDWLLWILAATRSFVWYGFLLALIAAQLQAGRVLRTLVGDALRRPSLGDLEGMLRRPLGDPGLRLGFRNPTTREWVDADGGVLAPGEGQRLTEFEQDSDLAVAIVHDVQLSEDPELLETAAEVALLALEHVELATAQERSLRELADSRARLTDASDRERRKLERDLHDGAQQRLTAVQIKLQRAIEGVDDERLAVELDSVSRDATAAVAELRTLSHGIYPTVLRSAGVAKALRSLAMTATVPITVVDEGIGRSSSSVEAAIYFCCAEAIQNATKHAGEGTTVRVTLGRDHEGIHFTVADDGVGLREPSDGDGDGLVGMRDRLGAVGGELEIQSAPGRGTTVRGWIPAGSLAADPGAT
jgi:signal transduction histidine kinase